MHSGEVRDVVDALSRLCVARTMDYQVLADLLARQTQQPPGLPPSSSSQRGSHIVSGSGVPSTVPAAAVLDPRYVRLIAAEFETRERWRVARGADLLARLAAYEEHYAGATQPQQPSHSSASPSSSSAPPVSPPQRGATGRAMLSPQPPSNASSSPSSLIAQYRDVAWGNTAAEDARLLEKMGKEFVPLYLQSLRVAYGGLTRTHLCKSPFASLPASATAWPLYGTEPSSAASELSPSASAAATHAASGKHKSEPAAAGGTRGDAKDITTPPASGEEFLSEGMRDWMDLVRDSLCPLPDQLLDAYGAPLPTLPEPSSASSASSPTFPGASRAVAADRVVEELVDALFPIPGSGDNNNNNSNSNHQEASAAAAAAQGSAGAPGLRLVLEGLRPEVRRHAAESARCWNVLLLLWTLFHAYRVREEEEEEVEEEEKKAKGEGEGSGGGRSRSTARCSLTAAAAGLLDSQRVSIAAVLGRVRALAT